VELGLTVQYTGTGFLIDTQGAILTNNHVTVHWKNAGDYQYILAAGYEPDLVLFQAFFPNQPEPFALTVLNRSQHDDIALLHANLGEARIPALRCASDSGELQMGETVMVIGYPTGFDAMLARIDHEKMEAILGEEGLTFADSGYPVCVQESSLTSHSWQ
jgi:S1-C subfamily serine protease